MNTSDAKESMASPSLATPATMEKNQRERQLQDDGGHQEMKSNNRGTRKKKPKRKKFTPKVIREGKTIRNPKKPPARAAKAEENSSVKKKENSSVKREYVHPKRTRSQTVKRTLRFADDQERIDLNETPRIMSKGIKRSHIEWGTKKKRSQSVWRNLHFGRDQEWVDLNETPCVMLRGTKRSLCCEELSLSSVSLIPKKKRNKIAKKEPSGGWKVKFSLQNISGAFAFVKGKEPNSMSTSNEVERGTQNIFVQDHSSIYGPYASNHMRVSNEVKVTDNNTNNTLVQSQNSTSSTLIVYRRRGSTFLKKNVDCIHPRTPEKASRCSNGQENRIYGPQDSVCKLVFNQEVSEPPYKSNVNCIGTTPEKKLKCYNKQKNEIQSLASNSVLVCSEETKTNNESVQARCFATSRFNEDNHKVSVSIKAFDFINVGCTESQTPEKVSRCSDNQKNEILEPLASENTVVFSQAEKPNDCPVQAHSSASCSLHNVPIRNLVNMDICSQTSASEKPPSCSNDRGNMHYGPQARIELLIAKQAKSRGKRCGKKGRALFINSVSSNKMVNAPIACETSCNKETPKTTDLQIVPIHCRWTNSNNREGPVFQSLYQGKPVLSSLEYIIQRLRYLNINSVYEDSTTQSENALPFAHRGVLVTFKSLIYHIKKRKPKAKVDVDPESNRMWELLMGNELTYGDGGKMEADKDKDKWWEEERQIFYGRVSSFTAKMELILGNRRFSPWKGSIVDSVVGVFLTQNVSDHLSSSAFMSLAARFPLRSKENGETANVEKTTRPIIVDERSSSSEPVFSSDSCALASQISTEPVTSSQLEVCAKMHSCCQKETCTCLHPQDGNTMFQQTEMEVEHEAESSQHSVKTQTQQHTCGTQTYLNSENVNIKANLNAVEPESNLRSEACISPNGSAENLTNPCEEKKVKAEVEKEECDWERLRREALQNGVKKERSNDTVDSLDYKAVICADNSEIAHAIRERGQNNNLAIRIKDFLNRMVKDHGSINLEWLRDVPPEKAKDYLLSIDGLGIKSVECVRLLTLHHQAFPVDTNVGRICVRLGWVPLQPLPTGLPLHSLEIYPVQETVQKYLWPRLCKLDHETLYKLHYLLIAFGKVFCTKRKPNCNACPMRGECKHFASAFASTRLPLPAPEEASFASTAIPNPNAMPLPQFESTPGNCEPIIELPASPELECMETVDNDIEDYRRDDPDIPPVGFNSEAFTVNVRNCIQEMNMRLQEGDMSKALVSLSPEAASIPAPKLKNITRLRTTHQAYELKDSSPLLEGLEKRDPDDPCPYLLAIWTPGETSQSTEPPKACCDSQGGKMCDKNTCFNCNSMREAQAGTVRGTLLIPCRTANRGSFPLNGTYFQVNEVFADHYTSHNPIDVPRDWIWSLRRSTVFFGTSVTEMFKGLTTEDVQRCFWRGYVCVRAFDRETRMPKLLCPRLHLSTSMATKIKGQNQRKGKRSTPVHGKKKVKGIRY